MMAEIFEVELVAIAQMHDLAHLGHARGRAVGRKPHHLVLVAVMGKAEILRERLVEDAERVREMHPPLNRDARAASHAPGGTGKIAEAVD